MRVQCSKCIPEEGIDIPDFSFSEQNKILKLMIQSPMRSFTYLMNNLNLSHRDAKYIITHINKTYGHCNRCTFEQLEQEYRNCPKCGALNFNWKTNTDPNKYI